MVERARTAGRNQIFTKTASDFIRQLREDARTVGLPQFDQLGSHAFRRGMARDIVDGGGSLATLLRAGEWRSAAFVAYLKEHHAEDNAISQLVVDHSDSD